MATQKQIDANRLNALKSTGPRTEEGKAKTRLNALRDGLTGQAMTLSPQDLPVFETLKAEFIADLAPETVMENKLASSIAWDTWRLDHLRAIEMSMYALGTSDPDCDMDCDDPQLHTALSDAKTFVKQSAKFALMSLYEQRMNRSLHKNLATLRELQAERKRNYQHDRNEEVTIASANKLNGLAYEAPATASENGYVFETSEIVAAATRNGTLLNAISTVASRSFTVKSAGTSAAPDDFMLKRSKSTLKMAAAA